MQPHRPTWTIAEYLRWLLGPLIATVIAELVWYGLWRLHFYLPPIDGSMLHQGLIGGLTGFHGVLAGLLVNRLEKERHEFRRFIRTRDEFGFRLALQEWIHADTHFFLGILSFLIVAATALYPYESMYSGLFFVGAFTLALAAYWRLATFLDNPLKDPYIVAEIPRKWLERLYCGDEPVDRPERGPFLYIHNCHTAS